LFDVLLTTADWVDYRSATNQQPEQAATYNKVLRQHGILKSPAKMYPSLALTDSDIEHTEMAVKRAVAGVLAMR